MSRAQLCFVLGFLGPKLIFLWKLSFEIKTYVRKWLCRKKIHELLDPASLIPSIGNPYCETVTLIPLIGSFYRETITLIFLNCNPYH